MLSTVADILRSQGVGALWSKLKRRARSRTISYGLRRDLTRFFTPPHAAIPISVRPATAAEIRALLAARDHGLTPEEWRERMALADAGLRQAYVAVTADGRPCYLQWLMSARDNDRIQRVFHGTFPRLADDEALLEGAYTPPAFRGLRIMPAAMARIAERARDLGARAVLTFVVPGNIPSLKGCQRAGFVIDQLKRDEWRWFRRSVRFEPLPAGTPYPFEQFPTAA